MLPSIEALRTAYNNAVDSYTKQTQPKHNRGIGRGYLTYFRHSCQETETMKALKAALDALDPNDTLDKRKALQLVVEFVQAGRTENNHSFLPYFMDELKKLASGIDWNKVKDKTLAISTSEPVLYLSTEETTNVFVHGFASFTNAKKINSFAEGKALSDTNDYKYTTLNIYAVDMRHGDHPTVNDILSAKKVRNGIEIIDFHNRNYALLSETAPTPAAAPGLRK